MKKILSTLILGVSMLLNINAQSQIEGKEYWQKFDTSDGLASNNIHEVFIQNDSTVWLATDSGLTLFDGANFQNYRPSSFLQTTDFVENMLFSQGKLWMKNEPNPGSRGLLSFDGTSFIQYTTADGMFSNNVRNLISTSNDTLWMTHGYTGITKFDGTTFTHYPNIGSISISADSTDRIYAAFVVGAITTDSVSIYDNGTWSKPQQLGYSTLTSPGTVELKLASNGELLMFPNSTDGYYYQVDYPLTLNLRRIILDGVANSAATRLKTKSIDIVDQITWVNTGIEGQVIASTKDSLVRPHLINSVFTRSNDFDVAPNLVAVGTTSGLYIANTQIASSTLQQLVMDVNQLKTGVRTSDPLFNDVYTATSNLEFPKNSGNHGVFSSNFIVAAKKQAASNFMVYPLRGYERAFASGPISNTAGLTGEFILKLSKQEITNHQAQFNTIGYTVPDAIKNWPAYGDSTLGVAQDLAPFFDENSNGCYDPENGDYPIIKGDEAIYWINHPGDKNLELEYHWMLYGFRSPGTALDSSLFVQYTVVNRANVAFDSIKVGYFIDTDLGSASDDYVGCDSLSDIMYSYNGSLFDSGQGTSPGYGNSTPAVGVKFISDSMETMMYYNIGAATNGDPYLPIHWLNFMNAKWKNGQAIKYGGNGFNSPGASSFPTTHMFTGDPVAQNGWTELTPGGGEPINSSGDRRMFASIPYFSLQPNERKTIEIAVGFGKTPDTNSVVGQNIRALVSSLNQAKLFNDGIQLPILTFASTDTCSTVAIKEVIANQQNSLSVFPVPSSGELTVETEEKMRLIEVYDMKGALVMSLPTIQERVQLSLNEYRDGFYLIRVQLQDDTWMMKKIIKQ